MIRTPLLLALALLLLLAPAARSAEPAVRPFAADAASAAHTDGSRTIAFLVAPGTVRILDAVTGAARDVDVSAGCSVPPADLVAMGGGRILYRCPVPHGGGTRIEPRLIDLATDTVQEPLGARQALDEARAAPMGSGVFVDVGAHGLAFSYWAYHVAGEAILDVRTGELEPETRDATRVPNLDDPALSTALCAPLRRKPYDLPDRTYGETPPFDPFLYEPPYGVLHGPRTSLQLQRCDSSAVQVLWPWRRGRPEASTVQLASGVVSWVAGEQRVRRYAYLPACGVRLAWELTRPSSAAHLAGALVVSTLRSDGGSQLRTIPLTGVCERARRALSARAATGGRSIAARLRSGGAADAPTGGVATLVGAHGAAGRLVAARAGRVRLALGTDARSVRWRIGRQPWRPARGAGRRWTLRLPADRPSGTLTFAARLAGGEAASWSVRIAARG